MSEEMNWDGMGQAPGTATIDLAAFGELCKSLWLEKVKLDEIEAQAKNQSSLVEQMKAKILTLMESANMEKHHVAGFGLLYQTDRFTVSLPKDGEGRQSFFEYLKSRGIFDELITVNSQTLNAFYKRCIEEAKEAGNDAFKVPGLPEPKLVRTLTMRKG